MKKEDNIQIQMRHFKMENVRLHGEVSRLNQYVVFLEEENRTVESEIRSECQVTIDQLRYRLEVAEAKLEAMSRKAESETRGRMQQKPWCQHVTKGSRSWKRR